MNLLLEKGPNKNGVRTHGKQRERKTKRYLPHKRNRRENLWVLGKSEHLRTKLRRLFPIEFRHSAIFSLSFFHFQSIFLLPWFVMEQCRFARKLHSDSTAPSCCNRYRNQVFFPLKNVSLFYEHWLKKSFNEEKANKKRTTNVSFVDFEPASNRSMQCGIKLIMFFICASCSAEKKNRWKSVRADIFNKIEPTKWKAEKCRINIY